MNADSCLRCKRRYLSKYQGCALYRELEAWEKFNNWKDETRLEGILSLIAERCARHKPYERGGEDE